MRRYLTVLAVLVAVMTATQASAAIVSGTFSFTASGFSANGPTPPPVATVSGSGFATFDTSIASSGSGFTYSPSFFNGQLVFSTTFAQGVSGTIAIGGLRTFGTASFNPFVFEAGYRAFVPGAGFLDFNAANVVGGSLAFTPAAVPEPASLALFGAALAGLGVVRRRVAA